VSHSPCAGAGRTGGRWPSSDVLRRRAQTPLPVGRTLTVASAMARLSASRWLRWSILCGNRAHVDFIAEVVELDPDAFQLGAHHRSRAALRRPRVESQQRLPWQKYDTDSVSDCANVQPFSDLLSV